jgi:3-oxoadipate enol-lactonase
MPYLELNGSRFHYHADDYAEPWQAKDVVLLHHAAAGNLHRWRAWVPTLARHHQVIRFDMRGHADSQTPAERAFSLPELAGDIAGVMDSLGIEKVHLVGASAGGIISLRFAHDFPQRLHSLSLVASTPKLAQMGPSIEAGLWRQTLEEQGTKAWLLSDSQKRFGLQAEPGLVEWYATEGGKTEAETVLALQDCLLNEDLTPLLPDISVPTLILAAAQDEITPLEVQYLMAQQIPNSRLQTFEGVGHNMKVEIPDLLAGRVRDFIGNINPD